MFFSLKAFQFDARRSPLTGNDAALTFQGRSEVKQLILCTSSVSRSRVSVKALFSWEVFCRVAVCSFFHCLTLAFSSRGALYRRPLGRRPAAKPIRPECVQHGQPRVPNQERVGLCFTCLPSRFKWTEQIPDASAGCRKRKMAFCSSYYLLPRCFCVVNL